MNRVVGLDCQVLDPRQKLLKPVKSYNNLETAKGISITPTVANLAVKTDKRGRGIAKKLLKACEVRCQLLDYLYSRRG